VDVALKIWRFNSQTGERELKRYKVEAPEWACLLDVLDIIKDSVDGTLAYRKSCRMMICGSCGMRMDGAAVLACKERMRPIVDAGREPEHEGYSGFDHTDLERVLRDHDVETVHVAGLALDYCVKETALDARRAGFDVVLHRDATRAINVADGDDERAIEELRTAGVRVEP